MKPIKKSVAKFLIIFVSILLTVGLIFTFIPMSFGNTKYLSFAGNINYASDIRGGMYAEYKFNEKTSNSAAKTAVSSIKSILASEGYANAFVAKLGKDTIRVEIGLDTSGNYQKTQSMLEALGVGVFELRTGTEPEKTFINGRDHIREVSVGSSGESTYVRIAFNKQGLENYRKNMKSSATIYVYMGGNLQTSFQGSAPQADDMFLTFEDFSQAEDFAVKVKLGSLVPLDFLANETRVNTMSSPLSTMGLTANTNSKQFNNSSVFVACIVAIAICVTAILIYMIIRFKAFGICQLIALLCNLVISIFLMQALPWVEISLSAILIFVFGFALMFYGAFNYIFNVQSEFNEGKTLTASLESGYKKSLFSNSVTFIGVLIVGLLMAIFVEGAVRVAGVLLVMFSLIGAFNSLVLLPWFINIYHAFNTTKTSAYGLKNGGDTNDR